MSTSFQQWPEFLRLLQQWKTADGTMSVCANVIDNFISDQKLDPEMFDIYRRVIESHFKGAATIYESPALGDIPATAMMEQWLMAHQRYFEIEIRTPNSLAFRHDRMLNYFAPNKWLLWLRRANVLRPEKLGGIKKQIADELERLELRGDDDAQFAKVKQDFENIKKAIELNISSDTLEKVYDDFFSALPNDENLQTIINAFDIHATYDDRNGQPVYVGFADDFLDVLLKSERAVTVKKGHERDVGTVIRNRLGISSYTKDDPVVFLCYQSPNYPSHEMRLAAPTVLDTTASNEWFFPTPIHFGRLGHTICMDGQYAPHCEVIHPQRNQSLNAFVWAGRIQTPAATDVVNRRSTHASLITEQHCKCAGNCRSSG
jgi:hypothetical protein